jgi:hypothetical protein
MEEAPENGKESPHSAHANGLIDCYEWNRWHGKFVLERSSSETQSISVAMEHLSVEHWAFAVEAYLKKNDSVVTQRIFRRHFNIHRNECP